MAEKNIQHWNGLLRWSLQHYDGTTESNATMDAERREFLENAFKSMTVDIPGRMRTIINTIKLPETGTSDEIAEIRQKKLEGLIEVEEYVENIDFARDFHKMGGLETIVSMLAHPDIEVAFASVSVFYASIQNNPAIKTEACRLGAIPALSQIFNGINATAPSNYLKYYSQIVMAVTGMIIDMPPILLSFAENGVIRKSIELLQGETQDASEVHKIQRRLLKLLQSSIDMHPSVQKEIVGSSLHSILIGQLGKSSDVLHRDAIASSLEHFASNNSEFLSKLKSTSNVIQVLKTRQHEIEAMDSEDKASCEEEAHHIANLLNLVI